MAAKVFDKDIVSNPAIVGFMLAKNFSFFDILNNPIRIIGPMRLFTSKLKDVDKKKARALENEIDDLERKMKSADKDQRHLGWIRTITAPDAKTFSAKVSKHPQFKDLKDFQEKLGQIRTALISIGTKVRKLA